MIRLVCYVKLRGMNITSANTQQLTNRNLKKDIAFAELGNGR